MDNIKFCPFCGIGLSNSEKNVSFCQNCKTDFSENRIAAQIEYDDDEDDLWADDEEMDDYDYQKEQEEEERAEIAASCKCGAWVFGKTGNAIHVADCCCGAE